MGRKALEKKRLKRPRKQRDILLQLVEFYKKNRLSETNMDDVAAYLNKSKATIYKYFRGKEQIVEAIIDLKIKEISVFVEILNDEEIEFFNRYEKSFEVLAEHIADISNEFLLDLKAIFPSIYHKIELLIDLAAQQLEIYYEKGMQNGTFRKLNAKLLAYNDFVIFRSFADPEFLQKNDTNLKQAFTDFYEIRCFGLVK